MYSFVIFDVDGTLIDTEKAVIESYKKLTYEGFGRHFTNEELYVAYGIPTAQAMACFGFRNIEEACRMYFKYLFEAFTKVKPFDGIVEVLKNIKEKGVPGGILTSRNREEIAHDVSLQKLLRYISHVVSTEDTVKHKPDPEPALKLLELAGAEASRAIYLGDTYYDYMCAKNAGVKFALAAWGARDTNGIEADYILNDPRELLKLVLP